jgi:hypothetical protein
MPKPNYAFAKPEAAPHDAPAASQPDTQGA